MAKYKIVGSFEEFYEADIEAPDENTAIQIFYQNASDMTVQDTNWTDIHIDSYLDDDDTVDYTIEDYNPNGAEIVA
jgi:ribosome maturation factor RimP